MIIGIYVNLMTKINVLESVRFIKQNLPSTKIILGGPDVRYNSLNYLSHGADVIVYGEGEETMRELCETYRERAANRFGAWYFILKE